ncbi:hypothetical protein ACHAXA_010022 [Cyclostephanos tholiformis]|uniref:Uncharacterized protein n=1 Tax=Cyclostephanos tholiformis TaxID=382380 RepID=A0ABD3RGJ1_9STRA
MDPSSRHTADESGGIREIVFASDGLPSLVIPLPPPPLPPLVGHDYDGGGDDVDAADAIVESNASDPRAAFDVFDNVGESSFAVANIARERPPASTNATTTWEDPRRRLFRLRSEVEELERSLLHDQDGAGVVDCSLAVAASELKSRLYALMRSSGAGEEGLAAMLLGRQADLTSVIARDMERLAVAATATSDITDGGGEVTSSSSSTSTSMGGKIVYELYRDASSKSAAVPREAALEERLRKLELVVGSSSMTTAGGGEMSGGRSNESILERIDRAERLVREVDESAVEKLAARAKVVRADLEAAARARSKLSSSGPSFRSSGGGGGGGTQQQQHDARTITELHAAMIELDGLSAHLPALASRLLELSVLHANASDFNNRLCAAEDALSRSESTLASVEDALTRMEGGWKENIKIVERNVDRLDGLVNSK